MKDRTLKLLLGLIAMALWALILKPAFAPVPARAQGSAAEKPAMTGAPQFIGNEIYLHLTTSTGASALHHLKYNATNGRVYLYDTHFFNSSGGLQSWSHAGPY